jgi:hypothetical protein
MHGRFRTVHFRTVDSAHERFRPTTIHNPIDAKFNEPNRTPIDKIAHLKNTGKMQIASEIAHVTKCREDNIL